MLKYTVAEALPPAEELSEPPLFCVGALVRTIPDTRPGIGPEDSVATYGRLLKLELKELNLYILGGVAPGCLKSELWRLRICYRHIVDILPAIELSTCIY